MITLFLTKDDMQRIKHIISIYLFFTGFFPFFVNIYTSCIFSFAYIVPSSGILFTRYILNIYAVYVLTR